MSECQSENMKSCVFHLNRPKFLCLFFLLHYFCKSKAFENCARTSTDCAILGKKCKNDSQCCTDTCLNAICSAASSGMCSEDEDCYSNKCVNCHCQCKFYGMECNDTRECCDGVCDMSYKLRGNNPKVKSGDLQMRCMCFKLLGDECSNKQECCGMDCVNGRCNIKIIS